jgi:hypothetical protein
VAVRSALNLGAPRDASSRGGWVTRRWMGGALSFCICIQLYGRILY